MPKNESLSNNSQELMELEHPVNLRGDGEARSFVDHEGNTYLLPMADHDFEASKRLTRLGLSIGEVVAIEMPIGFDVPFVKYNKDTDLIPLFSMLNAALGSKQSESDVTTSFSKVNKLIKALSANRMLPVELSYQSFAIDKASGNAELLAPFNIDADNQDFELAYSQVADSMIASEQYLNHGDLLMGCFEDAKHIN